MPFFIRHVTNLALFSDSERFSSEVESQGTVFRKSVGVWMAFLVGKGYH